MSVTIFKDFQDISSPHQLTVEQALERIKLGRSKAKVEEIRACQDKVQLDLLKKQLPCVLFSVSKTKMVINRRDNESHRDDACVVEHSGYFALDFDKCDVKMKLQQLQNDPYIYATWLSATGTGVRALVRCPASIDNHQLYYTAFLDRYKNLDPTSRNISRICFESYDPQLWVNTKSLVWDKKLTEEQRRRNKESITNRRGTQVMSTAIGMVRNSFDGTKHVSLRDAAVLLGGYIATGRVNEEDAKRILEEEIRAKNPSDINNAIKTIEDGIHHGKTRPLAESKKIEKAQQYIRRSDGSYDFLADEREMTEYELSVINGTLECGLPTGLKGLNPYWVFKKHHLVWFIGADNVGKSFIIWYLALLSAKLHGWRVIIHSAENRDGQVRKKLKEFFLGKSLKLADDEELTIAHDFILEHFRIITSTQMHTIDDFLLKCEILIDEGFEADLVVGEPYNSFDIPSNVDSYRNNIHALNVLRVFKENYCSVWVADHINTSAARTKDKDGYVLAPSKADAEMGQMKSNKVDDMIIIHRLGNHPFRKRETQLHVQKIRDEESGGSKTEKDSPVIVEMTEDYCGYTSGGINPIKNFQQYNSNK
jgi:hypothetical protein